MIRIHIPFFKVFSPNKRIFVTFNHTRVSAEVKPIHFRGLKLRQHENNERSSTLLFLYPDYHGIRGQTLGRGGQRDNTGLFR